MSRIRNILTEMMVAFDSVALMWSDNEAMISFVRGEGEAKGCRHMELRMFYVREKYASGGISLGHMPGVIIPPDKFTKLASCTDHDTFMYDCLGHGLMV